MKNNLYNFINGGSSLQNGFIALAIISLIVLGCTCNEKDGFKLGKDTNTAQKPEKDAPEKPKEELSDDKVPSEEFMQDLAKTTLMNFNEAVQEADFSGFHKTVSKSWQRSSRPSQFEKGFKQFIDRKIDISGIRKKEAKFAPSPRIDDAKYKRPTLMLEGRYRVSPLPVKFELDYIFEDDEWRLIAINVDTRK